MNTRTRALAVIFTHPPQADGPHRDTIRWQFPAPPITRLRNHVAALALTALLGACSQTEYPTYRPNPAPRQPYDFVLHIEGAPGALPHATAYASYAIKPSCLPDVTNLEGIQYAPKVATINLDVVPGARDTYTGRFHMDAMEEMDYYGKGRCTWSFEFIDVRVSRGGDNDTRFSTVANLENLSPESAVTRYFGKEIYPNDATRPPQLSAVNSGYPQSRLTTLPLEKQAQLFTTTLTIKRTKE